MPCVKNYDFEADIWQVDSVDLVDLPDTCGRYVEEATRAFIEAWDWAWYRIPLHRTTSRRRIDEWIESYWIINWIIESYWIHGQLFFFAHPSEVGRFVRSTEVWTKIQLWHKRCWRRQQWNPNPKSTTIPQRFHNDSHVFKFSMFSLCVFVGCTCFLFMFWRQVRSLYNSHLHKAMITLVSNLRRHFR